MNNLQATKGCPDLGGRPDLILEYDGTTYNHCLNRMISDKSLNWLLEYKYARNNILPEGGGLNDQWEIDLIAFGIISSETSVLEKYYGKGR